MNKEQKLIKLRKPHLIAKQNIYKSFWKNMVYIFIVYREYLYTCGLTIKINEKNVFTLALSVEVSQFVLKKNMAFTLRVPSFFEAA